MGLLLSRFRIGGDRNVDHSMYRTVYDCKTSCWCDDYLPAVVIDNGSALVKAGTAGEELPGYIGYNPMVRAVWLNTSPRRRPRAVRPEGGVEGWCSHTARTIGLYPTYHHNAWKGMFLWSVDELVHRMANSEEFEDHVH